MGAVVLLSGKLVIHNRGLKVEPTEIQLARLDERMKVLLDRMEENHQSHIKTRAWMGQVDRTLGEINHRVGSVETSLANSAPTIAEFMAIKHKVIGAGLAGKWLWMGLGAVLGLIVSAREQIVRLLTGGS